MALAGYRLSPEQRRIWSWGRGNAACASQVVVRLPVAIAYPDVVSAVREVVLRHEILRTRFLTPHGLTVPVQVVEPGADESPVTREGIGQRLDIGRRCREERWAVTRVSPRVPVRFRWLEGGDGTSLLAMTMSGWCGDEPTVRQALEEILAIARGQGADPGEAPVQYASYAEWRNTAPLEEGIGDGGNAEAISEAALPFGRAADVAGRGTIGSCPVLADLDARDLATCASALDSDLDDVLFATWGLVVARSSRRRDFQLARMSNGRIVPALAQALGPFTGPAPTTIRLDAATTFADLVRQVRAGRLQPADAPRSDAPGHRLLFEHAAWPATLDVVRSWSCSEPFDVKMATALAGNRLRVVLLHDRARFDAATVRAFAAIVARALDSVAVAPQRALDTIPLADSSRRRPRSARRPAMTPPDFVHRQLEEWARRTPSAVAIDSGQACLTYQQLDERASALASRLRARGVRPEIVVPIATTDVADAAVACVAVLKAGGAYASFDTGATASANEPGPRLVLSSSIATPSGERERVVIDGAATAEGAAHVGPTLEPQHLACVAVSTGPTGLRKAVGVEHRQLAALAASARAALDLRPGARIATLASADTSIVALVHRAILPLLCAGATACIVPDDQPGAARYVGECDGVQLSPAQWRALRERATAVLPRRQVTLSGAACEWETVDDLSGPSERRVVNCYGTTEVPVALCHAVSSDAPRVTATVPVGVAVGDTRAAIVGGDGQTLLPGLVGEIVLSGSMVPRGYFGQPALTAETFVPDASRGEAGGRAYRTGDLGRVLPDGTIEHLGRSAPVRSAPVALPTPTMADAVEQTIASIWREVLRAPVERDDNFFALGGHSLLAIQIIARVKAALGANVAPGTLFDAPTVAGFAETLERSAPIVQRATTYLEDRAAHPAPAPRDEVTTA